MNITADKAKAIAILAGVAVAGFVLYKLVKGGAAVLDAGKTFVTETVNPFSDKNAIYTLGNTYNAQGEVDSTIGTRIYDITHNADGSLKWPWE